MMPPYQIRLRLGSFRTGDARNKVGVIAHLLSALTESNRVYLADNPYAPELYQSGVIYRTCERGCDWDRWVDAPEALRDGYGDCKDLVCWRIAELGRAGVNAEPVVQISTDRYGVPLYHVTLRRADGIVEDPSRLLGMKG
jgi:hypothetical protein